MRISTPRAQDRTLVGWAWGVVPTKGPKILSLKKFNIKILDKYKRVSDGKWRRHTCGFPAAGPRWVERIFDIGGDSSWHPLAFWYYGFGRIKNLIRLTIGDLYIGLFKLEHAVRIANRLVILFPAITVIFERGWMNRISQYFTTERARARQEIINARLTDLIIVSLLGAIFGVIMRGGIWGNTEFTWKIIPR